MPPGYTRLAGSVTRDRDGCTRGIEERVGGIKREILLTPHVHDTRL